MGKTKRNDPCPCGSGKKYKKCCGNSNVIELSSHVYNNELDQLQEGLIEFITAHYEQEIAQKAKPFMPPLAFMQDEEVAQEYLTGLTVWLLFNEPMNHQGQTIIDIYAEQLPMHGLRSRVRNTFTEWLSASLSVYEVVAMDEDDEMATIHDLLTNKEYRVPVDTYDLMDDTILIGALVPYIGYHQFCFGLVELFSVDQEEILSILKQYPVSLGRFEEDSFPEFLQDVLMLELDDLEWDNPIHEMVAKLFTKRMNEQQYGEEIITAGIMIWQWYCEKEQPMFKKIANYAAALEYLVITEIDEASTITQKELAKEYGISAGTISTNYRKLIASMEDYMLKDDVDDEMDLLAENPHDNPPAFNMEREMRDIQRLLDEQNFESDEDIQAFLDEVLNDDTKKPQIPMSARDQAQDLLFDAREVRGNKRNQLIEKALETYPNSPDAYILMAEGAQSLEEYKRYVQKAVDVGKKDLGKAFFMENNGHFWGLTETRPYMRAKAMYAEILNQTGKYEEAINEYEEMLRLNPNDNQGIRYLLLTIYMELEMYDEAKQLMEEYDENSAEFLFNKVLLHYATEGLTKTTKRLIKEAQSQNAYISPYLIGEMKIPDIEIEYVGIGDENEAIAYVQQHIHLWEENLELLEQL
ncbi:tetratricopeptide repeat protein [Virgibacillus sp. W0181]|uniref:tetratricopeptide repeat protein n=1 Tax=Virgibacillus sp. W0181 TaxID=3391581 RepID=UPI003F484652